MAAGTTSSSVQQLYADIVADLVPYYMDAVLLPNQQIIRNSLVVAGSTGSQVRFPLTNTYVDAVSVSEGASIIGTSSSQSNFSPTAANVTFSKRGVATDVSEESLEDGGLEVVRNAVITRLSSGLAQATDKAGLLAAKSGATLADTGEGGANAAFTLNFVMSPEAMALKVSAFIKQLIRKERGEFRGSLSAKAYGNPETSLIERMIRKVQRLSHMGVGLSSPKRLSPAYAG